MLHDSQGLVVTTSSATTIAHLNQFIDQSLAYGKEAGTAIQRAIAIDPDCAIAHAYAAAYLLSQETGVARRQAIFLLHTAQHHSFRATERERWYVQAIAAWAEGAIDQVIQLHAAIAQKYPSDLISVQQGQYHAFYEGDSAQLLEFAQSVLPANRDNHYLYGMVAFGLEQCGKLEQALEMGLQAVAINRHDPWAHHAIAHVLERGGRSESGIVWMESNADTWADCNSMLYTHNWWHIALYYLALGDGETVLQLYDRHIWGRADHSSPKDQVGAIATLLRLELRGVEVGDRWSDITPHLQPRLHEHALPFQDLHYVYALARTGQFDQVNEMLRSMLHHTQSIDLSTRQVWAEVAIPGAIALIAYAKGDWSRAIAALKPVLPRLQSVGGSHTQRELFNQIYAHALHQEQSRCVVYNFSAERAKRKQQGKAIQSLLLQGGHLSC